MRGVEEMWDSAGGRERGKGSNEAGEMYVWLPISNIYEERALRRGGQGKRGGQKGYSVMPALKNGKTREARGGWAGEEPGPAAGIHVEFAFSIFSAWAKAPAQQPVSRSPCSAWNGIARLQDCEER